MINQIIRLGKNGITGLMLKMKQNSFGFSQISIINRLDFGEAWLGIPCTTQYWDKVKPVFDLLRLNMSERSNLCDFPNIEDNVYLPLLESYIEELKRLTSLNPEVPGKLAEFILASYTINDIESGKNIQIPIKGHNIDSAHKRMARLTKTRFKLPLKYMPSWIVYMEIDPCNKDTANVYMDRGWQFSFQIRYIGTCFKPSLKFDIQIVGVPTALFSTNRFIDNNQTDSFPTRN